MTEPVIDKRKSPEHREHLRKVGFQKGKKKTGGRVAIPEDVKNAMAERSLEAVEIMTDIMLNSKNDMARIKAAEYMLSPFVSKAPTESKVSVNHSVSIADMLAEINQLRLSDSRDERKTIDITPTVDLLPITSKDDA